MASVRAHAVAVAQEAWLGHSSDLHDKPAKRQEWILVALQTRGFLSISDIARKFGVSHMTARRDIRHLQEMRRVRTVHGGVSLDTTPHTLGHSLVGKAGAEARIGRCAATLVEEADVIAIDAGRLGYETAAALPEEFRGTVITHSLPIVQMLAGLCRPARVVGLGGEVAADRSSFVGAIAVAAIDGVRVRTLFLTADAVDHRGAYVHSDPHALIKRELLKIADDTVLLAQHQCFAASAPLLVGTLAQISTIVTDRPPPSPMWAALDRARVRVLIATGEPPNGSADMRFKPFLAPSDAFLSDPLHAGRK